MTTDRGITAAQNYAAVMARPGDKVAAGDGLGAFGAALILSVQMHLWAGGSTVLQRLCGISAFQDHIASITIKRGNLITLDPLQSPAAQPREALDRLPAPQPITPGQEQRRHRSRGRAALPATPTPAPEPEGGGGWPMHATAQPWHAEGRPSPTGALRRLHTLSSCKQAEHCKRCKRNSGPGSWPRRMALTPATTDPCPTGLNARPESPCSLALSLAGKKKGFPASPRTLAVIDRGDRIRTCDLVLPKRSIFGCL